MPIAAALLIFAVTSGLLKCAGYVVPFLNSEMQIYRYSELWTRSITALQSILFSCLSGFLSLFVYFH